MKRIFLFSFLILIILAGLFIPSYLLNYKSRQKVNSVTEIKQDDHVSPAVLKTASAQLTDYQRMQLISGDWESDVMKAGDAEGELTKSEAVEKAKAGLKELYDNHNYPTDLTSGYNNWYKWDATLYKAVDAHFHSYAAYFWQFHFVRFDNSCSHSVLMMENGTILVAQTNCTEIDSLKHATLPDVKGGSLFEVKPAELSHTPY